MTGDSGVNVLNGGGKQRISHGDLRKSNISKATVRGGDDHSVSEVGC